MANVYETGEEVFERIDDAFIALDAEWRFTYLNERAEEVLDLTGEDVVGVSVWEAFPEAVGTSFQYEYERAMETQESVSFEEYYAPLEKWFSVTAYPSETGLSVYFRDVTERRERDRELERYESIVETVQDGIYVVNDEGRFTMVNDAYAEMVGYDRDELIGSHVSLVVDEATAHDAATLEAELAAGTRSTATMTATLECADGGSIEAEATFSLLPDGDRVGVVRDVTRRRARERKLELFERIIETVEDGIYAVDDDAEFIVVNDAFCEMTDYDRDELLGRHVTTVKDAWVSERAKRLTADVQAGDRGEGVIEFELETSDGERLPVESRLVPFTLDDGIGRCGVVRDVSDRKAREQELRDRIRQQEVVTELGKHALETQDIDTLMAEAVRLVSETLGTDYGKVLDLDAEAGELLLRQGTGWDEGVVGEATVSAVDRNSQAAHTLEATHPIVVEDIAAETRFNGPDLLTDHDVKSGISTIIGPTDDPWGILGTHDTERRDFSEHDVTFVRSVANILAAAIGRQRSEEALRRQHERLSALNDINSLVHGLSESMFGLSTQENIKQLICDRLAESDSYAFAWIGILDDGEILTDAEAGIDDYLDDLTLEVGQSPDERGPTIRAHQTGEIQVVQSVDDDPRYEPWRDRAEEYGYRASASVPIGDGGEFYGTLNLYSNRVGAFNDEERDALQRLGSIVAYALSSVERDRELQRERNRLEFMNRLLRHNLLNSLNVVDARLEMLDGRVDFEVSDHLQTAIDRTNEMSEFVEMVREVTNVIGSSDEQELGPVDIEDVVTSHVERTRDSYPAAEIHLDPVPEVDIVADDLIGEVLDNVLVNAVQHNPDPAPTVWVEVTTDDDEVVVTVADDGPGIPDDEKADIFGRDAKTFDDPSAGFGLYLVKEILDSYGGRITVEDNQPQGSRFRLVFQRV
ncbi:PAS domain S-box protein [Haloplanus aerogenes]|uniref:histidine kinase n=1 Tax=Haloplanus aerogenes TaxID=660522 RepID=A0A3M0DAW3_9EURY|nr:PAS domain S-box protein [Haloplanus aerogenes]AZH26077.1 PAS domain S-box protein [Haloplanus aerogenes]RMB18474.1 PAS domain S-box-containing protein [Haloplanus aerogenes]